MSTALVLGSSGFLGRNFVSEIHRRGYDVDECDLPGIGPRAFDDLMRALDVLRPHYDLVVHAAAMGAHRRAIDTGNHDAYNAMLDARVFSWVQNSSVSRLVYISSCAVYPPEFAERLVLNEDLVDLDKPQPYDMYAWNKLTGERLARSCNVPVTVVRPFSGYGPDQGVSWPFGAFIRRAIHLEDPFTLWGDGEQLRDWVHVDDIVRITLKLVDLGVSGPVNICTGIETSMRDVALTICREVGYEPKFNLTGTSGGAPRRVGDTTRLTEYGLAAEITLLDGIRDAIAYHTHIISPA